jgi:hypothetical protein
MLRFELVTDPNNKWSQPGLEDHDLAFHLWLERRPSGLVIDLVGNE